MAWQKAFYKMADQQQGNWFEPLTMKLSMDLTEYGIRLHLQGPNSPKVVYKFDTELGTIVKQSNSAEESVFVLQGFVVDLEKGTHRGELDIIHNSTGQVASLCDIVWEIK